jgi:hypothetical protein
LYEEDEGTFFVSGEKLFGLGLCCFMHVDLIWQEETLFGGHGNRGGDF